MSRTWGDIQLELVKLPGVTDFDLVRGAINDAYEEILDYRGWKGIERSGILSTLAIYETGTVDVSQGSTAIATTGVWTGFAGRRIRIAARAEFYTLADGGGGTFVLDRAYEGADDAAAAYYVFQHIYSLPSDAKFLKSITSTELGRPLDRISRSALNDAAPNRDVRGYPLVYAVNDDTDESLEPVSHQVELYPIPETAVGLPIVYEGAVLRFTGDNTDMSPLPWVSSGAILAGAKWRLTKSAEAFADFQRLLATMSLTETRRLGGQPIKVQRRLSMADRYRLRYRS